MCPCRSRPGIGREEFVIAQPMPGPRRWPPGQPRPRVVVFHQPGRLAAETSTMLWLQTDGAVSYVPVPNGDPYAYGRALGEFWPSTRNLIVVIPRAVPAVGTLAAMDACPELLCGLQMPALLRQPIPAVGCVKYSKTLMEEHPTLGYQAAIGARHHQPYRAPMAEVAANMTLLLHAAGLSMHMHGTARWADE